MKPRGSQYRPRGKSHWTHTKPELLARGERIHTAKLSEKDIQDIRDRFAAGGITQVSLAAEYSVSQAQISRIVRGKRWAHM